MRFLRRHSFWRSLRQRLCAGLTLLAYVLTAFGLPLPAGSATPCSGAACGCAADDCRQGSCCCTPAKKAKTPPKPRCTGKPGCTMPCCRHGTPSERCPHEETPPADDDAPASGVTWVLSISALKCRGHSTLWVSGGLVLPAPMPVSLRPTCEPAGWLSLTDEHAAAASLIPPDPPPRLPTV